MTNESTDLLVEECSRRLAVATCRMAAAQEEMRIAEALWIQSMRDLRDVKEPSMNFSEIGPDFEDSNKNNPEYGLFHLIKNFWKNWTESV